MNPFIVNAQIEELELFFIRDDFNNIFMTDDEIEGMLETATVSNTFEIVWENDIPVPVTVWQVAQWVWKPTPDPL